MVSVALLVVRFVCAYLVCSSNPMDDARNLVVRLGISILACSFLIFPCFSNLSCLLALEVSPQGFMYGYTLSCVSCV